MKSVQADLYEILALPDGIWESELLHYLKDRVFLSYVDIEGLTGLNRETIRLDAKAGHLPMVDRAGKKKPKAALGDVLAYILAKRSE